ncbi:MAG: hypothetical protein NT087_10140 [Deltaproteobacteria bacterium]|nr:hypothetical protein [Deltaproteobacteria bacterium]
MITIKIDGIQSVQEMLKQYPAQASRALETAIDKTAREIKDAIKQVLPQVFSSPTPYTMNSLQFTPTKGHNMQASVWFKEPDRMGQHYLVPEVEGGPRRLKGFELALGGNTFIPSQMAKLDRYGNLPYGTIVQILSVLGRAEHVAGFSSNITSRSKKTNRKPRDYVYLPNGSGKLPPGIYQRVQTGAGFGAKTKRTLPFGEYQKGRTRGRFASAIHARGLVPVLIQGKKNTLYRKRLPFYEIGQKVSDALLEKLFTLEFFKRLAP